MTQAAGPGTGDSGRTIGVGMLGYGMMGRAHSSAFSRLPQFFAPLPVRPELVGVTARDRTRLGEFARRFGWQSTYQSWQEMLADERVQLFDDAGPNDLHAGPCIAAARAGKHVICEKPLARDAEEALQMLEAVRAAGVKHLCGFNYRFVPAVRLARQVIEAGRLGKIYHFRARYLQPSLADPGYSFRWRLDRERAGSGVLGDIGSHIIDLARFLVGEPRSVVGATATFIDERPVEGEPGRMERVTTDDAFQALLEFEGGATGNLEGSKVALGNQNHLELEVNGSDGSLRFNLERLNELRVYLREDERSGLAGFREIQATGVEHPFVSHWFPRHPLGWDQTIVHELAHMLDAIAGNTDVAPYGATFEDGYRAAVICDAILASAESGLKVRVEYRTVSG